MYWVGSLMYRLFSIALVFLATGCFPSEQPSSTPLSSSSLGSSQASSSLLTQSKPLPATSSSPQVPEQPNCNEPQTQAEINACASSLAVAADKQLNQVYQKLVGTLKNTQREKLLVDAQLQWIKFRDTNCAFEKSAYEGGSISPTIYSSCIERMSNQRTGELENYLKLK